MPFYIYIRSKGGGWFMYLAEQIKGFTTQQAIKAIVEILSKLPEDSLVTLTYLAEKLTCDEEVLGAIAKLRLYLLDKTHPAAKIFKRVSDLIPLNNLLKIFYVLFNNAWFEGGKKRDYFEKNNGCRPPFILIISPTMRCNLKCIGCYSRKYRIDEGLPPELLDRILTECKELGIYFVTFLGGEPFVYKGILDICSRHPEIFFQIYTNGTLMDRSTAQRIREMGNAAVVVSLEGFKEETDARRGKGIFDDVMRTMDILREEKVLLGSSATVTSKNTEIISSDEFIDMMIEKGSIAQMYYQYIPVAGGDDLSLMPTPQQRNFLRLRDMEIRATKPIFILDFWNDGPKINGCIAAGRRYFHINSNGDVEPCVYTHFAVDNIKEKKLSDVIDSEFFRAIRRHQPHNPNHLLPCMIIDNPHILREIVAETGATPTHPGAEKIITDLKDDLDEYARNYAKVADEVWLREYQPHLDGAPNK